MRRLDRSEILKGWLLPAILLYAAQFFISLRQILQWYMYEDAISMFDAAQMDSYFTWLMPMIVCLPFALKFCDDWQSRFFHFQVYRSSPAKYVHSKQLFTFLTGGLTASLGTLLFFGILCLLSGCPTTADEAITEISQMMLERSGSLTMYIVEMALVCFFNGGCWALVGLAFSAFVPYRALVVCFPAFVQRFWKIVQNTFHAPHWTRLDLWSMGICRVYSPMQSIGISLGIFSTISILCCVLFHWGVKRRLENG